MKQKFKLYLYYFIIITIIIILSVLYRLKLKESFEIYTENNKINSDLIWLPFQLEKNLQQLYRSILINKIENNEKIEEIQKNLEIILSRISDMNNPTYGQKLSIYKNKEYKEFLYEINKFVISTEKNLEAKNNNYFKKIISELSHLNESASFFSTMAFEEQKIISKRNSDEIRALILINDFLVLLTFVFFMISSHLFLIKWQKTNEEKTKIKKESRAQSTILAMVSHEIKGPFQTLMNNIYLLEKKLSSNIVVKPIIKVIKTSSNQILTQINSLIYGAEIQSGNMTICPTLINDIKSSVKNVIDTHINHADEKNIKVSFFSPELIPPIFVDENRYLQIVNNLVSNAIRHTDAGEVSIHLLFEKDVLSLKVTDTGEGFPKDSIEKAFEPFSKLENQRRGGTGMGLTIVGGILKLMKGNIHIESEPHKGTVISVTIPVNRAE